MSSRSAAAVGNDRITDFDAAADRLRMKGVVAADVSVSTLGGDTIVDHAPGSSIVITGQLLTQSDITFDFV